MSALFNLQFPDRDIPDQVISTKPCYGGKSLPPPPFVPSDSYMSDQGLCCLPITIAKCYMLWEQMLWQTDRAIDDCEANGRTCENLNALKVGLEDKGIIVHIENHRYYLPKCITADPQEIVQHMEALKLHTQEKAFATLIRQLAEQMEDIRGMFDYEYDNFVGEARACEAVLRHITGWEGPKFMENRIRAQIGVLKEIRHALDANPYDLAFSSLHPSASIAHASPDREVEYSALVEDFKEQEDWEVDNYTGLQRQRHTKPTTEILRTFVGDEFRILPAQFTKIISHLRGRMVKEGRPGMQSDEDREPALDETPCFI